MQNFNIDTPHSPIIIPFQEVIANSGSHDSRVARLRAKRLLDLAEKSAALLKDAERRECAGEAGAALRAIEKLTADASVTYSADEAAGFTAVVIRQQQKGGTQQQRAARLNKKLRTVKWWETLASNVARWYHVLAHHHKPVQMGGGSNQSNVYDNAHTFAFLGFKQNCELAAAAFVDIFKLVQRLCKASGLSAIDAQHSFCTGFCQQFKLADDNATEHTSASLAMAQKVSLIRGEVQRKAARSKADTTGRNEHILNAGKRAAQMCNPVHPEPKRMCADSPPLALTWQPTP
jgi:hypothetical protein